MTAAQTLKARVIPSLLLRQGRLVKGVAFAEHRDAGNPATTARAHNAQGADELIVLDIDAAREGRGPALDWIGKIAAECFMPLAAGGGITTLEQAKGVIDAGADKVVLNTGALDRPALIKETAHLFGAQAVVLAVDVVEQDGQQMVFDHRLKRATELKALQWLERAVEAGAGEVRLCAVPREGTRSGFDLELIAAARGAVGVPIIIEGGAGTLPDVQSAIAAGADGVALGTLLVFSDNNIVKVRRYLAGAGLNVRL